VMAAPFWALALLHYWRALGEGRRGAWFLLAIDLGLLLLSSYVGLLLLLLLLLFTPLSARGRRAALHPEPWISLLLLLIIICPHILWLYESRDLVVAAISESAPPGRLPPAVWLAGILIGAHLGLLLLVVLGSGWPRKRRDTAPEIDRAPVEPLARWFVY